MRIEAEKKLFTRDDLDKMYAAGILDEDERVELIDGEIVKMSNPGRRHVACTNRTTKAFIKAFDDRAIVSIQNPFVLDIYNEPKPDVVVAEPRDDFYESIEISAQHALLVVEIADTTLSKDRKRKLPHYARLGIPEFWIEDVKHRLLLVYRDPVDNDYRVSLTFRPGETVSPLAFPDIVFKVEDLLG
ncbi:MAG: Uma2 family endonuclease [Acidobacteria bacterium]|nr:Uma2 family endonuclease [Acidobacteriota bacterium]